VSQACPKPEMEPPLRYLSPKRAEALASRAVASGNLLPLNGAIPPPDCPHDVRPKTTEERRATRRYNFDGTRIDHRLEVPPENLEFRGF